MITDRSHPDCWTGERYAHTCARPSGRQCLDCGAPAGTRWGPGWCPDCDVRRLDRITDQFDEIRKDAVTAAQKVRDGQ